MFDVAAIEVVPTGWAGAVGRPVDGARRVLELVSLAAFSPKQHVTMQLTGPKWL